MRAGIVLSCVAFTALTLACNHDRDRPVTETPRIELKATVAPFDETTVYAPIDGVVATLLAADGATVKAGDTLLTLSNPAIDRELTYARTALTAVETRIRTRNDGRVAPVVTSEETLAGRVEQLELRRAQLRDLLATGDVTRAEVERAESELAAATRDLDTERARAASAGGPEGENERRIFQAELDRARADITVAEQRKARLVVKSPASGTIRLANLRVGTTVFAQNTLASIADPSTVRVDAQLASELLRFVRTGQPVDVTVMTIPPHTARVPLTRVVPAGGSGGSMISVTVPNRDRMLQPGTPATITIQ